MEVMVVGESAKMIHEALGVKVFSPPPPEFNPVKATDRELLVHGFPTRPDAKASPKLRKWWDEVFGRPMHWIEPQFALRTDRRHGPRNAVANDKSTNWSGSVVFPPATDPATWIVGQWTVPHVVAPGSGNYYCAAWVGIDGDGSGDVLQAGTESEIVGGSHQTYAWWEWFPEYEVQIPNLAVLPGDVMYAMICVNSKTQASFFLQNATTRAYVAFTKNAPAGTQLVGNSAEWIVEAPTVGGGQSALAGYGMVYFDSCFASTKSGIVLSGGKGTAITMIDGSGKSISQLEVESDEVIELDYIGPLG